MPQSVMPDRDMGMSCRPSLMRAMISFLRAVGRTLKVLPLTASFLSRSLRRSSWYLLSLKK